MAQRIQIRRDTAANWSSANPVLAQGEFGIVLAATSPATRLKIGDGTTAWNSLAFEEFGGVVGAGDITNAKLADMAQATIKGRAAGAGTGVPVDLTAAQQKTILGISAFAETILDDADAAAVRQTLGTPWEPLGTASVSGAAGISLDNIFNAALYSSYVIEFELANATSGATLSFELRDATPASVALTQSNAYWRLGLSASVFAIAANNVTTISPTMSNVDVHDGRLMLWMPGGSRNHRVEFSYLSRNDGGTLQQVSGAGRITDTTPRQGIRFAMSSGNLTGTLRAWGVRVQT